MFHTIFNIKIQTYNMKKIIGILLMIMFYIGGNAQRDLMLSQQFFSRININPAGTGNTDDVDLFLLGRWQWMGIEDSPKSGVFNASNYFDNINSGLGLSVSYDDLGISNRTLIAKAVYAYQVNLNDELLLSLGASAGILYHYFDPTQHLLADPDEIGTPTFPSEVQKKVKPEADFGIELTSPKFLFGASVTHLLNNSDNETTAVPGRHFYFYARGLFNLSETLDIAPAIVYMHKSKVDRLELNAMLFYDKMLWGGITYRPDINAGFSSNVVNFIIGIEYQDFRFGYAFEWGLGAVNKLSGNCSELLLSYRIPKKMKNDYTRFVE